jgi:putative membrane protein
MKNKSKIKPTRIDSTVIDESDILDLENERITDIKGIGAFAKKSAVVFGLIFSIFLIGTIYDATTKASSMLLNSPALGIFYIILIVALIGVIGYSLIDQIISYKKLKRIDKLQQKGEELVKNPTKDVHSYAKEIITPYLNHEDSDIANRAKSLLDELDSMMVDEVLQRVDEKLLEPLDALSRKKITKYASQTALSTAISPVALIDAALIISRSHVMVHDIAKIYGYRPNFLGEVVLFKKVFAALAFASVTEILANHSHDIFGTTMLSKFSLHTAQGMANGILVARIGIGVIKTCRPMHYKQKSDGFLKSLSKVIAQSLFNKDK